MKLYIFTVLFLFCGAASVEEIGKSLVINSSNDTTIPENRRKIEPSPRASNFCLGEHNQRRRNNGKPTFTANAQLEAAARRHNEVMAKQNCFSHQCSGEPGLGQRVTNQGYRWSSVGENIASGYANCEAAVKAFMQSPGHRANILGNFRQIGCHRNGKLFTCVFGTPR